MIGEIPDCGTIKRTLRMYSYGHLIDTLFDWYLTDILILQTIKRECVKTARAIPFYVSCPFLCAFREKYRTHINRGCYLQEVEVEPIRGDVDSSMLSHVVSGWSDFTWFWIPSLYFSEFSSVSALGVHSLYNQEKMLFKRRFIETQLCFLRWSMHPPAH